MSYPNVPNNRPEPEFVKLPPLSQFALDKSDKKPAVFLGDTELEVIHIGEDKQLIVECDYAALSLASLEAFPDTLCINVHSLDGFGTSLFYEAEIFKDDSGELMADYKCVQPNKYWEGTWGLTTLLEAITAQVPFFSDITLREIEVEDDWKRLTLRFALPQGSAAEAIRMGANILKRVIRESEIALGGVRWKEAYATNERAFCEEVLAPLLRRMKFLSIRYTQGAREYGWDFTFSELTPFGAMRHYGLQAKAGDVTGGVRSVIDQIVGQADDALQDAILRYRFHGASLHLYIRCRH